MFMRMCTTINPQDVYISTPYDPFNASRAQLDDLGFW